MLGSCRQALQLFRLQGGEQHPFQQERRDAVADDRRRPRGPEPA